MRCSASIGLGKLEERVEQRVFLSGGGQLGVPRPQERCWQIPAAALTPESGYLPRRMMNLNNQVQDKVLCAFRAAVDESVLEWVEVRMSPCEGTVRLQLPGRFVTLLELDYQFEQRACRLLVYRDGKQLAGRCHIAYDDG